MEGAMYNTFFPECCVCRSARVPGRLSKFDQLEDRLSALLQRLEQQVLQQHHHHHNPVQWGAEGGPGSAAATAAATAGGAAAPLPEAGCSGLPVRQQQQLQQPAREQELGAAELHLIMGQLQRMEEQENALRCVAMGRGIRRMHLITGSCSMWRSKRML
eukprot:1159720-Pelagomonas_calceolata.AAC.16